MQPRLHLAMLAVAMMSLTASVDAQPTVNDEPLTSKWAPTEWGADDKVGAPNRTTPELVLKAVRLVKKGKSERSARSSMQLDAPAFGNAQLEARDPGTPHRRSLRRPAHSSTTTNMSPRSLARSALSSMDPVISGSSRRKACSITTAVSCTDKEISATGLGPLGVEHVGAKGFRVPRGAARRGGVTRRSTSACPKKIMQAILAS